MWTLVSEIARFARLTRRAAPSLAVVAPLAAVGQAAVGPAIAYTSMRMYDAILVAHSETDTIVWMSIEVGLAALVTIFTCLHQDTGRLLRDPLALEMTTLLARKLAAVPLGELEAPGVREQLAQARQTAEQRGGQIVVDLLAVLQAVVSLAICGVIVARFTWLAVLIVVATVPGSLVERWSARVMYRASARLAHDRKRFDHLEDTLLSGVCAVENKFLDVGPQLTRRLRAIAGRLAADQIRTWRRAGLAVAVGQVLPTLAYYGVHVYLGFEAGRGELSYGELTLCLISTYNTQHFSEAALFAGRSAGEGLLQLQSYFALLDRPIDRPIDRPPAARTSSEAPPLTAGAPRLGLCFEDVGFRYPGSDAWAVRHVNLEIAPGEVVAIVGGNGSGKSTLVRLMTALDHPTEGRVTLDGRDLAAWDEEALRTRFAVVFQDFARYRMSLRDNLALPAGVHDHEARLAGAFAASGVDRFVAELPRGAETALSPTLEAGVELSGGQWQKVALARAFVRSEADLLILDEPTSALDAASEHRVLEYVCDRRREQTVILITHRRSALRSADKVVLLDKGRASLVCASLETS